MENVAHDVDLDVGLAAICFTMNREGTKGLSAGAANCLCSWTFDRATGALAIDKSLPLKKAGVAAVALREDERIALTAGWDSTYAGARVPPRSSFAYDRLADSHFVARQRSDLELEQAEAAGDPQVPHGVRASGSVRGSRQQPARVGLNQSHRRVGNILASHLPRKPTLLVYSVSK